MNKTAIKNFSIWARNKLITDISYKAGLLGITEKKIEDPLPQSTQTIQFFDIGSKEPYSISGESITQRKRLAEEINSKAKQGGYATAYKSVIEEAAYTWFNRLIAIRFMEVNDYLPTRIRVLSSESNGKLEPDLVTHALETNLGYTAYEKDRIVQLKQENKLDELFRMLFIKQCNALNTNLPELFEKTNDYTELLLNISFTDRDGVVYHLVNDIPEDNFDVSKEGQVEIIGWLYQYYNTEPKDETFALLKKNVKITKERIPAATQLFTPHWIVRYMVENSLGRLWLESHPNEELKSKWKYYLDEAEQTPEVVEKLRVLRSKSPVKFPEDIRLIDPCMGSGHILVYAFDVLMQIYESQGYNQRDAAKNIIENNLYGLDIDKRAYQLAYFAVIMKARQYNRRILHGNIKCNLYVIEESNNINKSQLQYFGSGISDLEKNVAIPQIQKLLDTFIDAEEYGSILNVPNFNWEILKSFIKRYDVSGQISMATVGIEVTKNKLDRLIKIAEVMAQKYDVVITNPPYMGSSGMGTKLLDFVKKNYPDSKNDLFTVFIDKCSELLKSTGYQAMITMQAWMFLSSYEKTRLHILNKQVLSLLQIGFNSFPELNSQIAHAVSFILRNDCLDEYCGIYFNLNTRKTTDDKEQVYLIKKQKNEYFLNTSQELKSIPSYNFAYWLTNNEKQILISTDSLGSIIAIRQGLATGNNELYLKLWFEIAENEIGFGCKDLNAFHSQFFKYAPYNKSGDFRKWYGNNESVIKFNRENYNTLLIVGNHLPSRDYYFKKGITWSLIATNNFAARLSSGGFVFDVGGSSGFPPEEWLDYYLGLLCSKVTFSFLKAFNPTINFQVGDIKNIPVIKNDQQKAVIEQLVSENIALSRTDWDSFETSWNFIRHPLICDERKVAAAFAKWKREANERFYTLKSNEEELNRIFIDIYGLQDELIPEIEDKGVTVHRIFDTKDDITESMKGSRYALTKEDVVKSFVSYAVGCIFGRYSLDVEGLAYAGGSFSEQWSVVSGQYYRKEVLKKYGCTALSRINCLAEVNGTGKRDISDSDETAQRRAILDIRSDEKSGSIDSLQYSGGATEEVNEGVYSIPVGGERLECGNPDAINTLRRDWIPCRFGYFGSNAAIGGSGENVVCPYEKTDNCPLITIALT